MEFRKIVIYGLFVFSVIYGIYFHLFSDEGTRRGAATVDGPKTNQASAFSPETASPAGEPQQQPAKLKFADDWKKDPFVSKGKRAQAARANTPRQPHRLQPPKLSGISSVGEERMAVVDGRVLRIGDRTGPWRLKDIKNNSALFESDEGSVWVKLGG